MRAQSNRWLWVFALVLSAPACKKGGDAASQPAGNAVQSRGGTSATNPGGETAPRPPSGVAPANPSGSGARVVMTTTLGEIEVELYPDKAPVGAKNFLAYVRKGFYDGTIFHRVMPGFVIQGGGFTTDMRQKPTDPPITNEAANGLKNERGTLCYARTGDPNSATSQFFVNLKHNVMLDFRDPSPRGIGYAVFGRVVRGMEVVDTIAHVRTDSRGMHENVPVDAVVIQRAIEAK